MWGLDVIVWMNAKREEIVRQKAAVAQEEASKEVVKCTRTDGE